MKMYLLVVLITGSNIDTGGRAVVVSEFWNLEKCQDAGEKLVVAAESMISFRNITTYVCAEK